MSEVLDSEETKKEDNSKKKTRETNIYHELFHSFYNGFSDSLADWLTDEFEKDFYLRKDGELDDVGDWNKVDYDFQQMLIRKLISYSKLSLKHVKNGSKKKEYKEIVEGTKDIENLIWHDIYLYLVGAAKLNENVSLYNFIFTREDK